MQAHFSAKGKKIWSGNKKALSTAFFCPAAIAPRGKIVYTGASLQRKEVVSMLTVRGIVTLVVLIVLFTLAVIWISKNGGWKGEGCGGNCASCHQRCEKPKDQKDN